MPIRLSPTPTPAHLPQPYTIRQIDTDGRVLQEKQVAAPSCSAALGKLTEVSEVAQRIEVVNHQGEKVSETGVDYWRRTRRSRR